MEMKDTTDNITLLMISLTLMDPKTNRRRLCNPLHLCANYEQWHISTSYALLHNQAHTHTHRHMHAHKIELNCLDGSLILQ